ncbi:MAG TPA: TonB-dependent receptor [Steroidobacteraceae bacterium]|nr:TonB-dependent receptor [Steroidobacteraceae bacterium]
MGKATTRLALAGLASATAAVLAPQCVQAADDRIGINIDEVVVTAQKRVEKAVEVPASISVLGGERLELIGASSMADIAAYVPGFVPVNSGTPGQNMITIRGLSSSFENATAAALVATYIDDHPVGSSTKGARGAMFGLDLMPYDIDRVEVLRGPQGTLYGANTLGGLIKYVLRKPDLNRFESRVGADLSSTRGSGSPSYGGRAAINVPLVEDVFAVRLSAFSQHSAGYIDNVGMGTEDINDADVRGGRATFLWEPTEQVSVQGSVVYQKVDADDLAAVSYRLSTKEPAYGWLKRTTVFHEPFEQELKDYSLTVNWELPFATLTSASSLSYLDIKKQFDLSPQFGPLTPGNPNALAHYFLGDGTKKVTQEVRLASADDQRLEWMLGGFYTQEEAYESSDVPTYTPAFVPLPYNLLLAYTDYEYREVAGFGNVTFRLTEKFDIGAGLRYASNRQNYVVESGGVLGGGPNSGRVDENVTTYSVNARYHLSDNSMVYGRVATGYRPGGRNSRRVLDFPTYKSDTLTNYEIGVKGEFLERRLTADLAVFYIDWDDMQINLRNPIGLNYQGNGGTARSQGVELSGAYYATDNLKLSTTLSYTDSQLTQDAPTIGGFDGDQLPVSPHWTGTLMLDYLRPVGADHTFSFGGGYKYRDAMINQLPHTFNPIAMGNMNVVDAYVGYDWGNTSLRVFAKNVLDDESYIGLLNITVRAVPNYVPVQPRTFGVSVNYTF